MKVHYRLEVEYDDGSRGDWMLGREFDTLEEAQGALSLDDVLTELQGDRRWRALKPKRIVYIKVTEEELS